MEGSENIQSNAKCILEQGKENVQELNFLLFIRKCLYWVLENSTVSNEDKNMSQKCMCDILNIYV